MFGRFQDCGGKRARIDAAFPQIDCGILRTGQFGLEFPPTLLEADGLSPAQAIRNICWGERKKIVPWSRRSTFKPDSSWISWTNSGYMRALAVARL